jgi:hypothetical protein
VPVSFIANGAISAGDNVNRNPGLPAGRANGDLLIVSASARGAGALGISAGWTQRGPFVHPTSGINRMVLFWRIVDGTEIVPTVTYTGGVAGDSVVTQMHCLRDVAADPWVQQDAPRSWGAQTALGPIGGLGIEPGNAYLVFAHRADDWASVPLLSGDGLDWVSIGEPDTSVGNDAGHVLEMGVNNTASRIVVTPKTMEPVGGLAAPGVGVAFELGRPSLTPPALSMRSSALVSTLRTVPRGTESRVRPRPTTLTTRPT